MPPKGGGSRVANYILDQKIDALDGRLDRIENKLDRTCERFDDTREDIGMLKARTGGFAILNTFVAAAFAAVAGWFGSRN